MWTKIYIAEIPVAVIQQTFRAFANMLGAEPGAEGTEMNKKHAWP
jgi:hypothetical protein